MAYNLTHRFLFLYNTHMPKQEGDKVIYNLFNDNDLLALTSPEAAVANFLKSAQSALLFADIENSERNHKKYSDDIALLKGIVAEVTGRSGFKEAHEDLAEHTRLFKLFCEKHDSTPEKLLEQFGVSDNIVKGFMEYGIAAETKFSRKE